MDLLKLEDQTLANLYEVFKTNDKMFVTEGEQYTEGTERVLKLGTKNIKELRDLRNQFVYTVSDLMHAARMLMEIDKSAQRMFNIYSNMIQYVTTEIDMAIFKLGGEV